MFAAVREFFSRPDNPVPRKGRGRHLAALFLFEFVVVLLGVLAAQMVQEAASNSRERKDAQAAMNQFRRDVADLVSIAGFWQRTAPCLTDHVGRIATVAADGGTMSASQIGRVALPTPEGFKPWNESTMIAVRRAFGQKAVDDYQEVAQTAEIMSEFNNEIATEWAAFGLLDPSLGRASAEDRANVRLSSTRVRTELRMQLFKSGEVMALVDRVGVTEDRETAELYRTIANECGLLLKW